MPRLDRTFTGGDVIRIWANNLDGSEQAEVVAFFILIIPITRGQALLGFLEDRLVGLGAPARGLLTTVRILERIIRFANRINLTILSGLFEGRTRDEINKALDLGFLED